MSTPVLMNQPSHAAVTEGDPRPKVATDAALSEPGLNPAPKRGPWQRMRGAFNDRGPVDPVRDGRWWTGITMLGLSILLLSFVAHAGLFSAFQHERAQVLAYAQLREELAKAETPVGQLADEETLVEQGSPVALIQAPSIGLHEVVLEGTTADVTRHGVGHRRDTVMPGQAGTSILMGRQSTYGGPFSNINRLKLGDDLTVTTGQGTHTYRVFNIRRAGDPVPEPLFNGRGRLQLQTADGFALFPSGVMYVDAELITEVQESSSRVMTYPALPQAERAMGDDPSRWFNAFFLAFTFAIAAAAMRWLWTTWGRWHAWLIGLPVLVALGVATSDAIMTALPNLL